MNWKPYLPLAAFLVAVMAAGVAHGVYTDRWVRSPDREAAAARLANIPPMIGSWVGEDQPLDAEEVRSAGVDGYLLRVYRNPTTRQTVTLFVVSGRPGPVSVHTPDVCYQASGYTMGAEPARESIPLAGAAPVSVWAMTMAKPSVAVPETLTVRWTWRTPAAGWQAPDRPRMTFARSGVLYKLYVLTDRAGGGRASRADSATAFLSEALPILDRALAERSAD